MSSIHLHLIHFRDCYVTFRMTPTKVKQCCKVMVTLCIVQSTVYRIKNKHDETKSAADCERSGRPVSLQHEIWRKMVQILSVYQENSFESLIFWIIDQECYQRYASEVF